MVLLEELVYGISEKEVREIANNLLDLKMVEFQAFYSIISFGRLVTEADLEEQRTRKKWNC